MSEYSSQYLAEWRPSDLYEVYKYIKYLARYDSRCRFVMDQVELYSEKDYVGLITELIDGLLKENKVLKDQLERRR